jgi:2-polyprenyl-3-methyl-5-hydroxy-6-metoxy-1,4-benzoquinol methylase
MNKEYFKKYYDFERHHWWFKVRNNIIKDRIKTLVKPDGNIKILNIGVATGRTTEILSKYGKVTSIEYDKDCCTFLKNELQMDVINGSITELPFEKETFDMVFALDVIEHVDEDKAGVNEMYRVCKQDGIVFVTVPAFMSLWSEHDEVNQHKRRYKMPGVKNLFRDIKGEKIYSNYFNSILFIPIFCARKMLNFLGIFFKKKTKDKSDFEVLNSSLISIPSQFIFSIERPLLKIMRFPFGVSIIYIFKKT